MHLVDEKHPIMDGSCYEWETHDPAGGSGLPEATR